jgi:hypothetical protein
MNRTAALALALMVTVIGCDDDDDLFKTDGPVVVDAPRAETGTDTSADTGPAACTGTFAGINRTQLQGLTSSTGKCAKASDLDLICTGNISDTIRGYGAGCLTGGAVTEPALRTCITNMVNANYVFTAGCLDCYIGSVACSFQKCQAPCTSNPNGMECKTCQAAMGCLTAFFTCAGIMQPGGGTDAGADTADAPRDGGADGVDGGADAADAPADSSPDATAG